MMQNHAEFKKSEELKMSRLIAVLPALLHHYLWCKKAKKKEKLFLILINCIMQHLSRNSIKNGKVF